MTDGRRCLRPGISLAVALGVLALSAPAAWAQDDEATVEPAQDEPPSPARRWLVPEAAERRVAFDLGWGGNLGERGTPGGGGWLFGGFELDHESGLIVRSSVTTHVMGERRPPQTLVTAGAGYRWRGRYELGAAALVAAGAESLTEERLWAGGMGVFVGLGSPEGFRLTVTQGFVWSTEPSWYSFSAFVLAHELQIPLLVADRTRLFLVNRGAFTFFAPVVFANRLELHALIDGRWRPYAGILFTGLAVGAVGGFGFRFD
jgi:hypothetical protein